MPPGGMLLIIGGADAGVGTAILYDELNVIGLDIYETRLVQIVADAHQIPLSDGSVDAVWIQAVLEHVLEPWAVVREIHRVLKPDGIVYAETPFLQSVHEGAFDFTRFTMSGHRWLFRRFDEVDAGVVLGVGAQAVSAIELMIRGLFRSVKIGLAVKAALFWLYKLERFVPSMYSQDAASAVFFYGRRSENELSPKEMVPYYKGANRLR
jgi:ubiquinone/menaquinone biosynthesis C-methylase UbiE